MKKNIALTLLPLAFAFSAWGGNSESVPTYQAFSFDNEQFNELASVRKTRQDVTLAPELTEREPDLVEQHAVTVKVEQAPDQSSYLAICTEFQPEHQGFDVNYDSCVLQTANKGPVTHRIVLADNVERLIAVNWFYTETLQPRYSLWDRNAAESVFTVK